VPGPNGRIRVVTLPGRTGAVTVMDTTPSRPCYGHNSTIRGDIPCRPDGYGDEVATGTPATALLTKAKVAYTLHPYDHDPRAEAYGDEAAAALGVEPTRIFKTLIASVDGTLACAVVPVAAHLDLKALAATLGGKRAAMADPAAAARATGYVVGGISPIGQKQRLRVVIDASAQGFETVFVSAGRRGLQVQLSPADLAAAASAVFAEVAASTG
jgi:Cys-tRNA(Pro)/Cys-tRNA(Cys) deacylase